MAEDLTLAPCPFCGGPAKKPIHYNGTWETGCAGDHNCAGTDVLAPIACWNTRAPAVSAERPGLDQISRAIADGFSNGNEQYDVATEMQRDRYDMAAQSVLALFAHSAPVKADTAGEDFDAEWPRALARLKNTEPHPDQGIACVGTRDLEMALTRLEQFANVALGNAVEIGRLTAMLSAVPATPEGEARDAG